MAAGNTGNRPLYARSWAESWRFAAAQWQRGIFRETPRCSAARRAAGRESSGKTNECPPSVLNTLCQLTTLHQLAASNQHVPGDRVERVGHVDEMQILV